MTRMANPSARLRRPVMRPEKDIYMKSRLNLCVLVMSCLLLFSASAFAGNGSFSLSSDATLDGHLLPAGEYTCSWNAAGEVKIKRANKEVATVKATAVEREKKAERSSVLRAEGGGASVIHEVRFAGKKTALVFDGAKVAQKQ